VFVLTLETAKSGYRNEFASRSSLFVAHTAIYHVQFIASELPIQISQYFAKYDWQCYASEVATEEHIRLSVVIPPLYNPTC